MSDAPQPLITFVRYARNDGYAPNYERRLNLSVAVLIQQAEKYKIPVEILVVEWNPPTDRPSLASVLIGAGASHYATVRVVTVPPQYHQGFKGADAKGLHPARALNVGYRRARGIFATPFASDSLLSEAVFQYVAAEGLDGKNIYRLDRFDLSPDFLDKADQIVKSCNNKALKELCESQTINRHGAQDETLCDPLGLPRLHTNAAGDFLLMSRERWRALRGQPEDTDITCLDTDCITLHGAATHGGDEVRLPNDCRVYKISHGKVNHKNVTPVWNIWARGLSALFRLMTSCPAQRAYLRGLFDIPRRRLVHLPGTFPSFERNFYLKARHWHKKGKPVHLNSRNWGLGGVDLQEHQL